MSYRSHIPTSHVCVRKCFLEYADALKVRELCQHVLVSYVAYMCVLSYLHILHIRINASKRNACAYL